MEARRLDNLYAWWVWRKESVGFVLAIVGLALIALVVSPFAAVSNTEGKVVEFRKLGRRGSVETFAVIDVNGQQQIVKLDATPNCYIGKIVFIQRQRTMIGTRYTAPRGCY
ncbi:hypothetical protein [Caulobacter sp. 1776]|uniref:hypothetical protein n=1 Tax=Caulobacter sp. 1776 TaxID=3156420 RepID=UPI003399E120